MSDYYDAHPIRVPKIPLAITGVLGVEHESVALTVASFTGLPCTHLTHLVEHIVGASARRFIAARGEGEFRRIEAECLLKALESTPPGVIALGFRTLLRPGILASVSSGSVLVHVHQDLVPLAERIERRLQADPDAFLPWLSSEAYSRAELERLLEDEQPGRDEATLHVDATGRTTQSIALDIIEKFRLWDGDGNAFMRS